MKHGVMVNRFDDNDRVEIQATTLNGLAIEGLTKIGWSLSMSKKGVNTWHVVNQNDGNMTMFVEGKNQSDAAYNALEEIGWSVVFIN